MIEVVELPVEQEQDAFDPDILHTYCENGWRNLFGLEVMCCGFPAGDTDDGPINGEEKPCPLCNLANQQGVCACFLWKTDARLPS